MKDFNREPEIPELTMGMDVGDHKCQYSIIDRKGRLVEEGEVRTGRPELGRFFAGYPNLRLIIETGAHSRWVEAVAMEAGHEVFVANARKVRLISQNARKADRVDSQILARLGRVDPELLFSVRHRSEEKQADLAILKARDELVESRTKLINHIRGRVKSFGEKLPKCSAQTFHRRVKLLLPSALKPSLEPLLKMIEILSAQIRAFDRQIEQLCEKYPQTEILRQVKGVGPVLSLAFVLTVEDPRRFGRSREVGSYFGLVPKRDQSGKADPELRISKEGDAFVRKLLINGAHYILGPFGVDSDLRRHGEKIAARGGKKAKKRAVVAVARKLSVLLHRLWTSADHYEPLYNANRTPKAA